MKKILIPISALLTTALAHAQLSPTENYVYSKTYLSDPALSTPKTSETVQYFDGLGRPKQVVNVKASPLGKDVVTHIEYDGFGRQAKDFLPIPQSGTLNGAIVPTPLANAPSVYGSEKIYAEKILENSPLDRIQQQVQIGNDWANKPVKFEYGANVSGEVFQFAATTTWVNNATSSVLSLSGTFPANQLYKNTVTDEDGNISIEYKNGKGQIIMTRKHDGTFYNDTYYVYNEYDQLAFVLPQKALFQPITDTLLNDLCYQYRYDGRNRLVEKKLPGKGWEYMVYNKADQLIMSQDANMRASLNWMFIKYDKFGRVAYAGISITSLTRQALQTNANASANVYESRSTTTFTMNGMPIYYSKVATPVNVGKVLTINYYDSYPGYSFNPSFPSTIQGEPILTEAPSTDGRSTKGLPVMSLVKNIEDDNWTKNYTYYDTKGRAVGSHSINHLGGYTKTESRLDFAGVPQTVITRHKRLDTDTGRVITENFIYDNQNRLLVHKHQVDSNPEEILAQNKYNELSQLENKKVGGISIGSPLQSIDYKYNIRGWMTKINDPDNLNGKLFGYEMKYTNPAYTNLTAGKYNGNIAEIDWKTSNDSTLRRYDYQYDALNRLKSGIFSEPNSSVPQNNFFNESMSYDLNGNITTLQRNSKGLNATAELIDNLNYSYTGNRLNSVTETQANYKGYPDVSGNTIAYDDNGNMKDQKDKGILDIQYNFLNLPRYMMFDRLYYTRNTQQNENVYNFYRADGTKLRKEHRYSENSVYIKKTVDYLDGFQYEALTNNIFTIKFVPTSEGYFNFENNKYIYNYTDHLGNVRLSYFNNGSSAEVLEENNYYPFGLKHEGYNALTGNSAYKYQYNGKELQQETGQYDYGARMYMPDIGRWGVVDPLAEKMRRWSPYNYAFNNPIRFIDPDGRAPLDDHFNKNGRFMYRDNKKTNNIIVHTDQGNAKLSQLDYNKKGTLKAVSNIISHYAGQKGLSGYYGVSTKIKSEDTGAQTSRSNGTVFYNSKQLAKGGYDNLYDLKNTLDHEAGKDGHKNENVTPYTFLAHAKVYLGQSKTSDYGNSTERNQNSVAFGFTQRLWNAYKEDEISWDGMNPYIDDFNKNNKGGVYISTIGGYENDPMQVVIQNGGQSKPLSVEKMTNPNE